MARRWLPSLVGGIVLLVGVANYRLLRQSLLAEIERDVERRAEAFAAAGPVPPDDLDTFVAPDVFLQVVGPEGGAAGSVRLPG